MYKRQLQVFDLDLDAQRHLRAREVASLAVGNSEVGSLAQLELHGDLLQWRNGGSYLNAAIPLNNTWALNPETLAAANEPVGLRFTGADYAWREAQLAVSGLAGDTVATSTQVLGRELRAISQQQAAYQPAGLYRLQVSQAPLDWLLSLIHI